MRLERFETSGEAGRLAGVVAGPTGGAKLPVVFIHGINMSSDVWTDVVPRVAAERRAAALDLRGHGRSDRRGPFHTEDYASDVVAVLGHLSIERAHLVGTSFGGAVACAVAVRARDRVASLVAIGSALRVDGLNVDGAVAALRATGVREFFRAFLPQASFAPDTPAATIARALEAATADRDVETVIAVSTAALRSDWTALGARVTVPALVVTGELDATCPVAAGEAVAKTLRAELCVLPGRGHVVPLEDPAGVAELVCEWTSRQERPPG